MRILRLTWALAFAGLLFAGSVCAAPQEGTAPAVEPSATPSPETPVAGAAASAPRPAAPAAPADARARAMWTNLLLPMWQRIASALPITLKAILLLLIFWIAALIASAAVRKLLTMTDWDNRLIRE